MKLMDSFTNEKFAQIVAQSKSYAECLRKIGYSSNSGDATQVLKNKINDLHLSTEHFLLKGASPIRTEEEIFCENSEVSQKTLRKYYKQKFPQYNCSICNLPTIWNNKKLVLILDHINGNNHDNRIENLRWVCPNCNSQLDTTNARNPNHKKYYCEKCGKPVSAKHVKLCLECYKQEQNKEHPQRKVERPSREELKKMIRSKPFTQIGKHFGVTDNTIRKWCDAENLPRTKREINSYSDIEWKNI